MNRISIFFPVFSWDWYTGTCEASGRCLRWDWAGSSGRCSGEVGNVCADGFLSSPLSEEQSSSEADSSSWNNDRIKAASCPLMGDDGSCGTLRLGLTSSSFAKSLFQSMPQPTAKVTRLATCFDSKRGGGNWAPPQKFKSLSSTPDGSTEGLQWLSSTKRAVGIHLKPAQPVNCQYYCIEESWNSVNIV